VEKVNLAQKFGKIREYWKPYVAAELNGQLVKLDKLKGEFVWHRHESEDEMFLVVRGRFRMDLRDRRKSASMEMRFPRTKASPGERGKRGRRDKPVMLEEGEFLVVPRGVEHRPVADEEAWVVLFEPASTFNTGNVENERSLRKLERI
jgi:mannose-6-phosphate isomerase-like protein (cupin superfamily)